MCGTWWFSWFLGTCAAADQDGRFGRCGLRCSFVRWTTKNVRGDSPKPSETLQKALKRLGFCGSATPSSTPTALAQARSSPFREEAKAAPMQRMRRCARAFTQACTYPDGTKVSCAAMLDIEGGKIVRQTAVQATKGFARFARSERISDASLSEAARRAERGLVDADLGGGVVKQRVARTGPFTARQLPAARSAKASYFP